MEFVSSFGSDSMERLKKAILEFAVAIGNSAIPFREWGIPRSAFYEWKAAYAKHGEAGIVRKKPITRSHPNQLC